MTQWLNCLVSKHGGLSPELHGQLSVVLGTMVTLAVEMGSEPHGKLSVLLGSYGNMGCGIAHMSADQHLRLFSDLHTCAMWQGYLLVYIPMHTCSMHKYIQIKERF